MTTEINLEKVLHPLDGHQGPVILYLGSWDSFARLLGGGH